MGEKPCEASVPQNGQKLIWVEIENYLDMGTSKVRLSDICMMYLIWQEQLIDPN